MGMQLKISALSIIFATISIVMLTGFSAPEEKNHNATGGQLDNSAKASPWLLPGQQQAQPAEQRFFMVAQAGVAGSINPSTANRNAAAGACMESAKSIPKTGNPVVDTRCSLVAFEVCMHKATGIISQSQGTTKQCTIIQGLGGAAACQPYCTMAAALPVGGKGKAALTYTGLTPAAVSCYDDVMDRIDGVNKENDDCNHNHALQCLMNGSASPSVNAAILRDRKSACKSFNATYGGGCSACAGDNVRVDYDPAKIDLDSKYCTPALAAAKQCTMPVSGGGK